MDMEKAMATHSSTLAWKIPWTEEPGGLQSMGLLGVGHDWATFTFHFHALEKETATHSSILAWRIPGTGEPGRLLSMGSHRVRHNWSNLAAAYGYKWKSVVFDCLQPQRQYSPWNSPGQNTGVGSCSLPQGIFPTQGSNPGLSHCRRILYQLSHKGSPMDTKGHQSTGQHPWLCIQVSVRSLYQQKAGDSQTGASPRSEPQWRVSRHHRLVLQEVHRQ